MSQSPEIESKRQLVVDHSDLHASLPATSTHDTACIVEQKDPSAAPAIAHLDFLLLVSTCSMIILLVMHDGESVAAVLWLGRLD
jgi:hypothetical protein